MADCYVAPGASGLHDASGHCIQASVHRRRPLAEARWFNPPADLQRLPHAAPVLPPLVFLPYLQFAHFGHCLTETAGWLSSLLRPRQPSGLPQHLLLGGWAAASAAQLCSVLQLDRSKVFTTPSLNEVMHLPEVWLPVPSMVNRDRIDARHSRAVRRLLRRMQPLPLELFQRTAPTSTASAWLYLSRSRLNADQRRIEAEDRLADQLQRQGWTVIHPQQLPLAEQLQHLRQAEVVAGPLGSAFHLLLPFGSLPHGPLVITLGLADELTQPGPGMNFGLQFARQQLPHHHLPVLRPAQPCSDPAALPRHADLTFALPPHAVADQLQRLAHTFHHRLSQ